MSWLILALISYFLSALVVTVDKFLLANQWRSPMMYAVYVGVLNACALFFWPLDFSFLNIKMTIAALASGAVFFWGIFSFYSVIIKADVSKTIPIIGGFSAFLILIFSFIFLNERLPGFWLASFFMLIIGTFLLSFENRRSDFKINKSLLFYSFSAALFFALSFFLAKIVFLSTGFINGFVWMRVGVILSAIAAFLFFRGEFRSGKSKKPADFLEWPFWVFFLNKFIGAFSFILLNYAIMLGSVTMVNVLGGVEYMFVILLSFVFSLFLPLIFKEQFSPEIAAQKFIGAALISLGVAFLFFFS